MTLTDPTGLCPPVSASSPTAVVDSQGNPILGVNPDGSMTPMSAPAGLPLSYYTSLGETAALMDSSSVGAGEAPVAVLGTLLEFAPGLPLDAQRFDGTFYPSYTAYSNFAFGVYAAAAGVPLPTALWGANLVAGGAAFSPAFPRGGNASYPNLLNSNYANIVAGYTAYASGQIPH